MKSKFIHGFFLKEPLPVFIDMREINIVVGIANFDNQEGEDLRLVDAPGEGRVAG
jgi:hypothetical protein